MTAKGFYVGQSVDGKFTAFSNAEPAFCLTRDTEEEAIAAGNSVFASFKHLFLDRHSAPTEMRSESFQVRTIRTERALTYDLQVA